MKHLKFIPSLLLVSLLSSCSLVDLGLAYLGYSIVMIIALAIAIFLFNILYGLTKSQGWSLFLTVLITFLVASYIFKW